MKQFPIGQNHGSSPASATMREYIFHNLAKRKYYIRDMISLPAVLKWTAGEELVDRRRDVTVRRLIGKVNICLLICCFITFLWLKLTKQETHSSTTLSTDNESIYHLERSSRHEELSKPPLPSSVVVPLSSSSSSTSFTDYQNVENISNSLFESSKSIYLASAGGKIKLREGAPKYSSTRSNTSFPSSTSSSSLNSVQRFQRRNEIQVQASGSSSFTGIAFLLDITCTPSTTIYKTVPSQDMLNSICDDVERAAARAAERLARVLFVRSTVRISVDYEPFCDLQGLGTTSLTTSNRNTASSAKKRNALKKRSLLRAKTNKIGKFRLLRRRSAVKDRKEIPIERDIYPAIGTSDSSSSTFSSFSSACGSTDQTLARAAPSAYHTFSKAAADQLGVDANYLYPAALAKQYAPNDPVFQNSTSIYDIAVTFNADFSWWFSTPQDPVGESSNSDGLQGKGTMQDSIHADYAPSENIYDFEQIMVHELCHGLGFISNWNQYQNNYFMPGSLLTNISTGVITGFGGLYIFDRLMSDAVNHAWMSDYAAIISQSAANVSRALNTTNEAKWVAAFDKTLGGSIAKILFNMNSVLPESLVYWYPTSDFFSNTNRNKEKYWKTNQASSLFRSYPGLKSVVLYTPTVYSSGSSISHVDSILYEGSTEYLMRPYGTPGVSLDAYTPRGAYGPIGEHVLGILRGMGWATALGPVK